MRLLVVGAWLVSASTAVAQGRDATTPPAAVEAAIASARVRLVIHRAAGPDPRGGRVAANGSLVEGVVVYTLANEARAGETLRLLDFAAFMREEPTELDEVALASYVAGPFQPASMEILGAWGGEVVRKGARRDLVVILPPGAREVTLRYRVEVPHRYWPLGCVRRRCSLSGAIAPLPSEPAQGGPALDLEDRVITPVAWTVEEAVFAIPGDVYSGAVGRPIARRRPDEIVQVGGHGEKTLYPSIFWGPRWHRTVRDIRGLSVEVLHAHPRPSAQVPHETFTQWRRDVVGHVLRTTSELLELAWRWGLDLRPSPGTLVVVEGPLRSEIAQYHPGLVMLSDQTMQLLPLQRLLKFHQEAVARSLADALFGERMRELHTPSVALWASGQMASAVLGPWQALRLHRDEYAHDMLRRLTFMPTVDRFLYTQQAAFSQSYFRGVEDVAPLRNHPMWFSHRLPHGRRIHEKLSDTLRPEELRCLYTTWFSTPSLAPRPVAERAYGYSLDWFFAQWIGPYPAVDYAVASVRTQRFHRGYTHIIEIAQDAERPLVEPVEVLVEERGGRQHHLVWNGELEPGKALPDQPAGGRHRFVLQTRRPLARVRMDPRRRLVQRARPPHENVDPLFNDRRPPSFRFLYTGAGLSVAASEFLRARGAARRFNAVTGYLAFEGSLRRDLRRSGNVTLARDRENHLLVGAATSLWWGEKVNRQRRRGRVRIGVDGSWLSPQSLDPTGGMRLSERISIIDDTRRFLWWPERGHRLEFSVASRQVWRIDGSTDDRFDIVLDGEWSQLWRIASGHVLASMVHAEAVIPLRSKPEFRSLPRVGGIGGLSGYLADEAFGLAVMTTALEYRHKFIGDLHLHALHWIYLRGLGGVAFAGVASASSCASLRGWFGRESWYTHVGYGLTAELSVLGVTPQVLRVEAAVPLVRRSGTRCLGETLPDLLAERQGVEHPGRLLPPFNLNVLFSQPF